MNALGQICRAAALRAAAIAIAASAPLASAFPQSWPAKPIRAIIPIAAGSAADIIPRTVFEHLSGQLGQPIVVENRPGAGGTIGAAAVAKSDPDGHTILVMSSSYTIAPSVYPALSYDAARDLTAIVPLGNVPNVLVVAPSSGFKTVQDFVAAARTKGTMNYASVGAGTAMHLNAERFRLSARFEAQHVPFKGAPQAIVEVMTGRIDFTFVPVLAALPFIRDGKLTALAVGSSARASSLPDVPTTVEAGFADSHYNFWLGMFVPAQTPRDAMVRLANETQKSLQNAEVREKLAKLGVEPLTMTSDEFQNYVGAEIAASAVLVKAAGITAQQ